MTTSESPSTSAVDAMATDLAAVRARTLALVGHLSSAELERQIDPILSPLVWDLGHIAAFEDLWLVHRFGGRALLREDLAHVYDAFETPRSDRGELPYLRPAQAREYLDEVRARTLDVVEEQGIGDGGLHEMVLRHELQHGETMLQTIQLARLNDYRLSERRSALSSAGKPAAKPRVSRPSGI